MVVPLLAEGFERGITNIPHLVDIAKGSLVLAVFVLLKIYFGGTANKSERLLHGKVILLTGGTSGIGACIAKELATRGAQILLLTHHAPSDPFLVEYIDDLRTQTDNQLIYTEQVDLSSLHSVRLFATKWVDNAPPRRLDMIILCADVQTPKYGISKATIDGVEEEWMVDYLSTFHLLSILSPAIRAQPPDRDVRIIFTTCTDYMAGKMDLNGLETKSQNGSKSHSRAKLASMVFAQGFQKHLDAYKRPDKQPINARVLIVDPGFSRTPGMRRWLTGGSLLGLLFYVLTWPLWWLLLKSPEQGAQSHLFAAMDIEYGRGQGGKLIKECREINPMRPEVKNDDVAKTLWEYSEKQIERLEKQGAVQRALRKKEDEMVEKSEGQAQSKQTSSNKQDQTPGSRRSRKAK